MTESTKKMFIHCPELEEFPYPDTCPFKTSRAGEVYKTLESMGLLTGADKVVLPPEKATDEDLLKFHSQPYLNALKKIDAGEYEMGMLLMQLGTGDCPAFEGVYQYALWAAGATITAARQIIEGNATVAFNPSGGYHHAFDSMAGGFCYINDVVLGCMELADAGKKVLFLDIDVHHCDGVQSAFYERADVMTISMHQDGRTLFPGCGFVDEIGDGEGEGYSVNLPLPPGTYDEIYLKAFREAVLPLIHAYGPDAIVLEAGADTLQGDPLAGLSLTNNVHVEVINALLAFGKPILATGGGGYNVENTVRAWSLVWTALCGEQMAHEATAGMGGVMLETTEWANGAAGLRDRVLIPSDFQRREVDPIVENVIEEVKNRVFPIHRI
ncbi:MAG: acetoin utilization protein AcuC [Phycisphaerae bacterium]|nr:acetoin utilization protein AcuC [Phycisphaerae bacterium]